MVKAGAGLRGDQGGGLMPPPDVPEAHALILYGCQFSDRARELSSVPGYLLGA